MLFYTQIRREFTPTTWRRGQTYFREERISNVKLEGDLAAAKVQGTEPNAYDTALMIARGTILNSKCTCPAHRVYETHCKHVAALAIWLVERGSLLRAGVKRSDLGMAADGEGELTVSRVQEASADPRLRKLFIAHPLLMSSQFVIRRDLLGGQILGKDGDGQSFAIPITLMEASALSEFVNAPVERPKSSQPILGEPVWYVKGLLQGKALLGISVESAIRYADPDSGIIQIHTLPYLTKQYGQGLWKTSQGHVLKVPPPLNAIDHLDVSPVVHQDQNAVENLARLMGHPNKSQIVFDASIQTSIDPIPLKLVSLSIGRKFEQGRMLSYEFAGAGVRFNSEELEELAKQGRLSSEYVWKGDRIYRFAIPILELYRYANRTGILTQEGGEKDEQAAKIGGFGVIPDHEGSPLHPLVAYRLSLELGVKEFKVDAEWEEFQTWKKIFERKKIDPLPKMSYGFKLRTYQKNGLSWLWSLYHRGLSGLLADEMGLGKTHQVLAFLSSLYRSKKFKPAKPTLVVAPTSVIAAWAQKLKKYKTGLKYHIYHGAGREFPNSGRDIILTTYGILSREPKLRERQWHAVILDEAQTIKNAGTLSSRACRMLNAKFRIIMTGTPVENQPADLWSLMEFLLPGYLGSLSRFKRIYGSGRDSGGEKEDHNESQERHAALRRMIAPFMLRRTKSQVLKELPEKTEEIVLCEMTATQKKAYRHVLNSTDAVKARENLESGMKIDHACIFALLTRLKQVCDHPKLADLTAGGITARAIDPFESGKWDSLSELLNEALGSDLKVVVFTQYLGMMDILGSYLKAEQIGYAELRGDTNDRTAPLERFAADPDCRVFICSLLAGGMGIDLVAGSVCIHLDRWWNPAKENQATDRLHRLGQTRGVQVFKLQVPGSVEDRIAGIIESKLKLSDALIEESSVGLKTFSRKELLSLLAPIE